MLLTTSFLLVYFLVLFIALARYNQKFLNVLLFVLAALLFSFRYLYEDDTIVYNIVYNALHDSSINSIDTYGLDWGFLVLMKFFSISGLSFYGFRMLVLITGCLLMYGTIKCLTEDISLVMCFYLYFPFCYDSYQIRQFLAYSIVVFGIRFLIQEKREIGKYVLCVLIATLLHKSAVVYFLYLLSIFSTSENNFGKHILRVTVIASVLLVFLRVDIIGILGRLLKNDKFISYSFSNEEYRMNFYLQLFEIAMMVIILLIDKTIVAWNENNEYYAKLLPILEISLLFLPFIIISLVFERLIRPFLIFSYCLVSSNLSNDQEQENSLPFILLAAIIIIRMSVSFGYIEKLFSNCTLV